MKPSSKTLTIGVRLAPELWTAAQKVAALTGRSGAALIEYALRLFIEQNYPEAMNPKAKITVSLAEAPTEKAVAGRSRKAPRPP